MKFDIARQPLVPAFLTLFALAVAAMCGAGVRTGESAARLAAVARTAHTAQTTAQAGAMQRPGSAGSAESAETGGSAETEHAVPETRGPQYKLPRAASAHAPVPGTMPETNPGSDPGTIPAQREAGRSASEGADDPVADLAVSSPGELLFRFQTAFPGWARLIAGFLILFAGMSTGRLTVRYNLYSVGTCLAIPLYGITACGVAAGGDFLPAFAASALLTLAVKNFSRSFRNGYAFDTLFRGGLYLGLLPLVSAAALPLLLLLPLALLLFRRTVREAAVAAAGLLLPLLALCYVNWGAGGAFTAPVAAVADAFAAGSPFALFASMPLPGLILLGSVVLLDLAALLMFLSDIYAAGTKPRFILVFSICTLIFTLPLLAGPAAARGAIALAAVPSAILLPVLFVRIGRAIALPLYLLLLCAAFAGAILQ